MRQDKGRGKIGIMKDLRTMSKEYIKDPHGQYYKNLDKILKIGLDQGIPKKDILKHVEERLK